MRKGGGVWDIEKGEGEGYGVLRKGGGRGVWGIGGESGWKVWRLEKGVIGRE